METLLTIATWIGLAVLGTGFLLSLAMAFAFISVMFGSEKDKDTTFNFYKGDLDDD